MLCFTMIHTHEWANLNTKFLMLGSTENYAIHDMGY